MKTPHSYLALALYVSLAVGTTWPAHAAQSAPDAADGVARTASSGAAAAFAAPEASAIDPAAARLLDRLLSEAAAPQTQPLRIDLREAVRLAVANNPGIRARAEIPQREGQSPLEAAGAFDPTLRTGAGLTDRNLPSANALESGRPTLTEDAWRAGISISKLLQTGATVGVDWSNARIDSNSRYLLLNPRYDLRLNLGIRQPLLRNIGASDEQTTVLVATAHSQQAQADFEAELAQFVAGVIGDYWGYVGAAAELEVARRSVVLAQELVRDSEAKVSVGLLAPMAVKEAKADAAAREERRLVAENALVVAGRTLQHDVMAGAAGGGSPPMVTPVEEHVVTDVALDRRSSLTTAVTSRAEVRSASVALAASRLEEKRADNQKLPSLDVVARYGLAGLSGDARPVMDSDGNVIISGFAGDYGDALGDMVGRDYTDVAIGIELEVPLGNSAAKATQAKAQIEVRRAARELEQTVSGVALDVDKALADAGSAYQRVAASKLARELAEENLVNQRRRFDVGAVTIKDVLDFQEKLAEAMATEVQSITDHANAVTRLRLAEGTLLAGLAIEVAGPDAPTVPWWAKF